MNRQELILALETNVPNIEGKEIWIWGVGHTAELYQEGLKRIDKFEVCGYCDNNPERWGQKLSDKPIISPEEIQTMQDICVFICSPQNDVIKQVGQQLDEMKKEWYKIDEAILKLYRDEIINCYDLLEDQFSKDTYAHIIDCRLSNKLPEKSYIIDEQYFCFEYFEKPENEIFIDCGAYTGDTIEQYIIKKNGKFKKIIAFEPDRQNYNMMQCNVDRLKREYKLSKDSIDMFCCGVGERKYSQAFKANGTMSSACLSEVNENGEGNIDIVSLDDFCSEQYNFLKADIESYEYNMLVGAQNSIIKNKPILAICIYHNAVDMFSIMLFIHNLIPEYKFSVRHHSDTFDETVLYAYAKCEGAEIIKFL